jgi:hypothetical protein
MNIEVDADGMLKIYGTPRHYLEPESELGHMGLYINLPEESRRKLIKQLQASLMPSAAEMVMLSEPFHGEGRPAALEIPNPRITCQESVAQADGDNVA